MDANQLETFEYLAHAAQNPSSTQEMNKAKRELEMFHTQPQLTVQLKYVLENGNKSAQLYAALCLNVLVTSQWNSFTVQTRIDIRNYVLTMLAERGVGMDKHLLQQLISLVARITKLGWFDQEDNCIHQKTVDQVTSFFRPDSPHHSLLGLSILCRLLGEIGQGSTTITLTQHRKISISFRDLSLLKIFKLSIDTLRAISSGSISDAEKEVSEDIRASGLHLALLCLKYDFVGTSPSAPTEDTGVLKIPNSWRPVFEEGDGTAIMDLFWTMFRTGADDNRAVAMEIIVELSSVRRSLFEQDEHRAQHLGAIMNGITDVLVQWQDDRRILGDEKIIHNFCRLLARLKGNFQLKQIVNAEGYTDWITLVATFCLNQDWLNLPNSHFYVMMLWSRLVAAIPYLDSSRSKTTTSGLLEEYGPKILAGFLSTRLQNIYDAIENDGADDDPLDNLAELEALPTLGRLKIDKTAKFMAELLEEPLQAYANSQNDRDSAERACAEGQLALLILASAGIVGGRSGSSSTNTDLHNEVDAILTARVLSILQLHDENVQSGHLSESTKRLELALLRFLQEFRKVYIGDPSLGTKHMFNKLAEIVGSAVQDSNAMMTLIVRKIVMNLRFWATEFLVIEAVTDLFYELITGYASIRLVIQLDASSELLANHTSENFPFLDVPDNRRCRVKFYTAMSKLLYMKSDGSVDGETNATPTDLFNAFVQPFSQRLTLLQQNDVGVLRQAEARNMLVGVALDLRGFVAGIYSRKAYERFFEWLYPNYMPAFHTAAEIWVDTPRVAHTLLKFFEEFVTNRSGRIVFDCASANGILLFKETSSFLCRMGTALLDLSFDDLPLPEIYERKYKTVLLMLKVFTAALQGNYCNFGVFKLYKDSCLTDCVQVCFELALSIPLDHIIEFPKLTLAFYAFVERMFAHHIEYACALSSEPFSLLITALEHGLTYSALAVSTQCCTALDNIATYCFKYRNNPDSAPDSWSNLIVLVEELQEQFFGVFRTLLHYTLFDDCQNQWSCTRPLFSLALILPDALASYSERLIDKQVPDNQAKLAELFQTLMKDCQPNLAYKTRDQFTNNFKSFKTDVRKFVTTEATV